MMNLVKWNPWREMPTLHNRMPRLFDDPFFRLGRMADDDSMGLWNPAVDLYEKDDHFVIKAELPGVDKNDIKVDLKDRVLTLSGERAYDSIGHPALLRPATAGHQVPGDIIQKTRRLVHCTVTHPAAAESPDQI